MYNNQPKMSSNNKCGYLEIIAGSMYSGKTSKLLEIYKQCVFCNIPVAVINYAADKRYDEQLLSTHDKRMIPCIQLFDLKSLFNEESSYYKEINDADVILINEGQFFNDLYEVVKILISKKFKKHVYICGLDGDFERKKFGQILDLIPLCDKVEKLTSLCSICKDGTPGIFSMRITKEKEQTLIGSDMYIPVCRYCYENDMDSVSEYVI